MENPPSKGGGKFHGDLQRELFKMPLSKPESYSEAAQHSFRPGTFRRNNLGVGVSLGMWPEDEDATRMTSHFLGSGGIVQPKPSSFVKKLNYSDAIQGEGWGIRKYSWDFCQGRQEIGRGFSERWHQPNGLAMLRPNESEVWRRSLKAPPTH